MNRYLMFSGCLLTLALACGPVGAQASFDFLIDASEGRIAGGSEELLSFDAVCSLVPNGLTAEDTGPQGWSVSIAAEGCTIVDATTSGTVGAPVDEGGLRLATSFEDTQLAEPDDGIGDCEGRQGAVSAVVLALIEDVTLDPVETSVILNLTVEATTPALPAEAEDEVCAQARLFYADGCRGTGEPVDNRVTLEGETVIPSSLGEAVVEVCAVPSCAEAPLNLIFQAEAIGQVPELFAGSAGTVDEGPAVIELSAPPGEIASGDVYVGIVSQLPGAGVQGWSLAVAVDDLNLVDATTAGTIAAPEDEGGLRLATSFELTEVVDPAINEGQQGAVSAVVLALIEDVTLDPVGTATVLAVSVESVDPSPNDGGVIRFQNGLVGSGEPVENTGTVAGETTTFCSPPELLVPIVEPDVAAFRTSDANGDARIDIADPIWIINELFRGGPPGPCPAAEDANDDGMVDLSDASLVITYLFLGGDPPIGNLECHVDPEVLPEDCPAGSTACP